MREIRLAELKIAELYPSDKIQSPIHLSIGQEAVATGVAFAMASEDRLFGTYRSHAIYLAKGGSLRAMFAELYARTTGCAGGKGGSMHLAAPEQGLIGCSAIVGGTLPIATGDAFASAYRGRKWMSIAFFGDGALGEGVFFESLNFAALKNLPILYVCENNELAVNSPIRNRHKQLELFRYGEALGVAGARFDGNDAERVLSAVSDALARIRAGGPPELLEFTTYRWREHVGPNADLGEVYRDPRHLAAIPQSDPLDHARVRLEESFHVSEAQFVEWDEDIKMRLDDAVAFADSSPHPASERLLADVYAS